MSVGFTKLERKHVSDFQGLKDLQAVPVELSGDDIVAHISRDLRDNPLNRHNRPADVRLLLRTAAMNGAVATFPNHGHPDNELSTVTFDGENAVVIMPAGDTPRRQLFSARQIVARLDASGAPRITPDFIAREITGPAGLCRKFAAQAYGPAPFDAQAARFVATDIPASAGGAETVVPDITDAYAIGMRAPAQEEAYLVVYSGAPADLFISGGEAAAAYLSTIEAALPVTLKGSVTTQEKLDGMQRIEKGIVLAVDAATGRTKPIRLETAKDIFDLARLSIIRVDDHGQVKAQYQNVPVAPRP